MSVCGGGGARGHGMGPSLIQVARPAQSRSQGPSKADVGSFQTDVGPFQTDVGFRPKKMFIKMKIRLRMGCSENMWTKSVYFSILDI